MNDKLSLRLRMPSWLDVDPKVFNCTEVSACGISGGRTSALMGYLLDYYTEDKSKLVYTFQNTGCEHENTYRFLYLWEQRVQASLNWLEFRKPSEKYAAPTFSQVAVINYFDAARDAEPFEAFLETLAEYREFEKGEPPLSPNPTMRLCTSYMKIKVQEHYMERYLGYDSWDVCIGLRADEPSRVAKMSARDTTKKITRAPLAEVGIGKSEVLAFFAEQDFDLELPENLGNCELCFLKDESDLAWNMLNELPRQKIDRWISLQERFGTFRKRGAVGYAELLWEAPIRFQIRESLQIGDVPACPVNFDARRFVLLTRQEQRIIREGLIRIPCSCESADLMTDEYVLEQKVAL